MIISTFQISDRDTQQAPILWLHNANGWGTSPTDSSLFGNTATSSAAGESGSLMRSFDDAIRLGASKTLNYS